MKKILLSSVALLGLSVAASAADLPRRSMAPAPAFVAAPVFTWTGFYVGVNVGYAWNNNDNEYNTVFVPGGTVINAPLTTGTFGFLNNGWSDDEDGGLTGGGQIGYNMQFGAFVVGVEADIQGIDSGNGRRFGGAGGTYTFAGITEIPGLGVTTTVFRNNGVNSLDWWGTVRARAGVAFDRTLIYATGGWAFGGGGDNDCGGFFAGGFVCGDDDSRNGYVVGGGVEYAFTNNLTAAIEGLYVNLDNGNGRVGSFYNAATNSLFLNTNNNDDHEFGVVRAKLNWKF